MVEPKPKVSQYLASLYFDPKKQGSFSGPEALWRAVKEEKKTGISRKQVYSWLSSQRTYTIHKQARRKFRRNRVIVGSVDEQWESDLAEFQPLSPYNNGNRYILICIDVLSKFAWAEPMKAKTGKCTTAAFLNILKKGRSPDRLHTDRGKEFLNSTFQNMLKEHDIHFFNTGSEIKSSIAERMIRTFKEKLHRYFTYKNTLKYVDVLQDFLDSYNNTFHSSIKTKPRLVNHENEQHIWHVLYDKDLIDGDVKFRFHIGDQVRITKSRRAFQKGYEPNFSEEIFTISKRIARSPPVYKLRDYKGDEIDGTFYEAELQKIIKKDDSFRVEKILSRRGRGKNAKVLVRWLGYDKSFDSWIPASDIHSAAE